MKKLTEKQRDEIAALREEGISLKYLAERFGVSVSTVWLALNQKTTK